LKGGEVIKGILSAAVVAATLAACSERKAETFTLYRNSPYAPGVRVHWATFDVSDSDATYNLDNCQMAARLLNANVTASAKAEGKERDTSLGFWCEPGTYREKGSIPTTFPEAFPTDA
jgi:hypothetical protein